VFLLYNGEIQQLTKEVHLVFTNINKRYEILPFAGFRPEKKKRKKITLKNSFRICERKKILHNVVEKTYVHVDAVVE
jgi:hypothetical protein